MSDKADSGVSAGQGTGTFTTEAPSVHYEPGSFTVAIVALDEGIAECGGYVRRHATGVSKYGWGWCMEAANVARALAEARDVLVKSLGPLAYQPQVLSGSAPSSKGGSE